jgi:two-component system, OmpR family, sensor kinase
MLRRRPVRTRLAAAFTAVMAVLLLGIGVWVYRSMATALLDEIDSGLRYRAAAAATSSPGAVVEAPDPRLEEPAEAFDQLVSADGQILRSSPGLPSGLLLPTRTLAGLHRPTFFERQVPGVQNTSRLLALPLDGARPSYLVVGTTMADRADALHELAVVFALAGPLGLAVAALAGWLVAGLALRPVERMRRQATAITSSGMDHRLDLSPADDELRRLAVTLNEMLDRLEASARLDRRFLEVASHELRTPLAALKAELDVARLGPQEPASLAAAIASAGEETDRLARLANDLLALARTSGGRLPVVRAPCRLRPLVEVAAAGHMARAAAHGIDVQIRCEDAVVIVDSMRIRQCLDNLLDNALRHGGAGGSVRLTAVMDGATLRLTVADDGPGFADVDVLRTMLSAPAAERLLPRGLGLQIVQAIVASHGGTLTVANEGGSVVTLLLPEAAEVSAAAHLQHR